MALDKVEIKNFTPHPIDLELESTFRGVGTIVQRFDPDPRGPARIDVIDYQSDVRLATNGENYGDEVTFALGSMRFERRSATGLPAERRGTLLIVSLTVAMCLAGLRSDLVVVHDVVRDDRGRPTMARKLSRII